MLQTNRKYSAKAPCPSSPSSTTCAASHTTPSLCGIATPQPAHGLGWAHPTPPSVDWKYEDAAARTLAYLKVVWNTGGKAPVQGLIKDITAGR